MNILIAIDSFKGTLTSIELAEIIRKHINKELHTVDIIAVGDGGEGTVDSLMYATNGNKIEVIAQDALGNEKSSYYCETNNGKTAILEIALSSGLTTINEKDLNPMLTTTHGLGDTINEALKTNISKLIIGIGGSSTNDAGSGMLQALGVKFYDANDTEIKYMSGGILGKVTRIDLSGLRKKIKDIDIDVACDVDNPLLGQNGCTNVYARQKGASEEMVLELERNLESYSKVVKETLGKEYKDVPGVGAAGGLGYALIAFLNARLLNGLEVVAEATNLEERIKKADIIITGEGSFDHQSLNGKAPIKIAQIAKKYNKQVYGIFGGSTIKELPELFDRILTIVPNICTLQDSLNNPKRALELLLEKECSLS